MSASAGKGKAIVNLANLSADEKVRALLSVKEFDPNVFVVMATRNGQVKKTSLENFNNPTARGIIAMGVPEDDELIAAELVSGEETVFIGTHDGMCIRFPHADVREMGRQAYGVIGIRLDEGDYVVAHDRLRPAKTTWFCPSRKAVSASEPSVEEYRTQGRGGKGIINVEDHRQERQGRCHHARAGRLRCSRHDGQRQAHPRPLHGHPRRRPRHSGRAADQSG